METLGTLERARLESWTDQEIVARVRAGDTGLYEIIMRRYNQRLYRVTRAILRDESEAEDVIQDAYVRAYQHLDQFAGHAPFSVWLTRIAVHEALRRLQQRKRSQQFEETGQDEDGFMNSSEEPALQTRALRKRRRIPSSGLLLPNWASSSKKPFSTFQRLTAQSSCCETSKS